MHFTFTVYLNLHELHSKCSIATRGLQPSDLPTQSPYGRLTLLLKSRGLESQNQNWKSADRSNLLLQTRKLRHIQSTEMAYLRSHS